MQKTIGENKLEDLILRQKFYKVLLKKLKGKGRMQAGHGTEEAGENR